MKLSSAIDLKILKIVIHPYHDHEISLGQFSSMHFLGPHTNFLRNAPLIDSVLFAHRVLFSQIFLLSFLCISFQTVLVILSTLILPYWIQIINLIKPVLTRIENSNSCQTFFYTYQDIYFVATDPFCSSTWTRIANLILFSRCNVVRDNHFQFAPDPDTGT